MVEKPTVGEFELHFSLRSRDCWKVQIVFSSFSFLDIGQLLHCRLLAVLRWLVRGYECKDCFGMTRYSWRCRNFPAFIAVRLWTAGVTDLQVVKNSLEDHWQKENSFHSKVIVYDSYDFFSNVFIIFIFTSSYKLNFSDLHFIPFYYLYLGNAVSYRHWRIEKKRK